MCNPECALQANFSYQYATRIAAISASYRPRSSARAGAKLFYLSGIRNGKYLQRDILNLARFISVMKFRPLSWRLTHPYLLTDRFEVRSPTSFTRRLIAQHALMSVSASQTIARWKKRNVIERALSAVQH